MKHENRFLIISTGSSLKTSIGIFGNIIDDGIRAEMQDDRKFFYPVYSYEELTPSCSGFVLRQWSPVGGEKT